jgi:uroporphyrinogen-III decarboxylase
MAILDLIADSGAAAVETLAPQTMRGDVDLREAKRRVGDRICLIGGFDQFNVLARGTGRDIEAHVRDCIESAATGGGYILCASDHFFTCPPENLRAYVTLAHRYGSYS